MEWHDDPDGQAATLIAEPYRCRVWRSAEGTWAAMVSRRGDAEATYSYARLEDAQAWCEAQIAASGTNQSQTTRRKPRP